MAKELEGRWALVSGASSGIGAELARELASRGSKLVLVSRRTEKMEALAREIQALGMIEIHVVSADLTERGAPERLLKVLESRGIEVSILANNAGFGAYGPFDSIPAEVEAAMLDLDIKAIVGLTRLFAGPMRKAGWGRILLTASTAAYQPTPLYASYAAAKAFVLSYGLAVRSELEGTGVSVTVLSPGVTRTAFHSVAGHEDNAFKRATMMEARPVARAAVTALLRCRPEVVPGAVNKLSAFGVRFLSRPAQASMAKRLMS
ncbi:MAG TPA: SDR family oxidoreductase [Rectinemataceae bacterium]|nr:SDR family oxidoreductase [Rectinemataceae bacterium]